jgi:hypothetical protein
VRFTNDGARPHSFAVEALDVDVEVPSGRTRTVVLRLPPGTYDYVCSVGDHELEGMKGRVVVVGADGVVPASGEAPGRHREPGHAAHDHAAHDHAAHGDDRG